MTTRLPPESLIRLNVALIEAEYRNARKKHTPMRGEHEGYAVILEEMDELWDEIKAQHPDPAKMRMEAIQIGAMALAFICEVGVK